MVPASLSHVAATCTPFHAVWGPGSVEPSTTPRKALLPWTPTWRFLDTGTPCPGNLLSLVPYQTRSHLLSLFWEPVAGTRLLTLLAGFLLGPLTGGWGRGIKLFPVFLLFSMSLTSKGPQQKGCSPWHPSAPSARLAIPCRGACGGGVVVMAGGGAGSNLMEPDAPTPLEYLPGHILSCQVRAPWATCL